MILPDQSIVLGVEQRTRLAAKLSHDLGAIKSIKTHFLENGKFHTASACSRMIDDIVEAIEILLPEVDVRTTRSCA